MSERFSAEVAIRRVADGEVRVYRSDYESRYPNGNYCDYIWSDGNYGCDCNRALFFARAANEGEPGISCGEGAFVIDWIKDAETGEVLYTEADA